ncbi:MAG: 3-methyl-2-oxobutanoate hydroxymethyltransferase [Verrucomicrobiota bacterium]
MQEDQLKVTDIARWPESKSLLAVTAYDYPMARHLDEAGVDILHVGDSLGMVVLGLEDTTGVTMADMIRATESVARARKRALITADLPYGSYDSPNDAVKNSQLLMKAGADAVKMEGGSSIIEQIRAVLAVGIPVQGHLGMLPQHIKEEGKYRKKGKKSEEAEAIYKDAHLLESEGVFSIILEAVVTDVAERITQEISVPTIGIASGKRTDGQIHVLTDIIGTTPWFQFPHVKPEMDGARQIREAIQAVRKKMEPNA